MRIAVAGGGDLAVDVMAALLRSRHRLVALIQNGRRTRGLKRTLTPGIERMLSKDDSVFNIAKRQRLPLIWIDEMNAAELEPLTRLNPDVVLVCGFGIILKRPLIKLPKRGCVNIHSSLLPHHRGPNPFSSVILAGEAQSGVTFHQIDEGIDTGDILDQMRFPVEATDTALEVYNKARGIAAKRVVAVMDRIQEQGMTGTAQDTAEASYYERLTEENAVLDWTRPARELERLVRAAYPFVHARFRFNGRVYRVTQAGWDPSPTGQEPGTVIVSEPDIKVATGAGSLIIQGGDCIHAAARDTFAPGVVVK